MSSNEPTLGGVPMELFLQDQRRQDEDMRDTRALISREVSNVVTEIRGLRYDTAKASEELRKETNAQTTQLTEAIRTLTEEADDRKAAEQAAAKRDFSRREKLFGLLLVAIPLLYTFLARIIEAL